MRSAGDEGTMNIGITVIKSRRSIRSFREESVPQEVIRDALECARLAPTARNDQPWLFGVIKREELLSAIAHLTDHGHFIAKAPVCFAIFGERDAKYYLEDCSAATTQLILGLWSHGVGSCWVAGDKKPYAEPIRALLKVPEQYTLVSLVPAGYPSDVPIVRKKNPEEIQFTEEYE